MKKMIFNVMAVFLLSVVWTLGVCAADVDSDDGDEANTVSYDMSQGGKQSFAVVGSDGEEYEIVIEELPKTARVANGSYKISKKRKDAWRASFVVSVHSNRITKASQANCTAIKGSISNVRLQKNSDAQATMTFFHTLAGTTEKGSIVAKIVNKKLKISFI